MKFRHNFAVKTNNKFQAQTISRLLCHIYRDEYEYDDVIACYSKSYPFIGIFEKEISFWHTLPEIKEYSFGEFLKKYARKIHD